MAPSKTAAAELRAWTHVPRDIQHAITGLGARELDLRGGEQGLSIRETVHHLVESGLVASNVVIAALARSGCTYDWSYLWPDRAWMRRTGYDKAHVRPALATLEALVAHVAGLVWAAPGGLRRTVKLRDAPGARLRKVTVARVLCDEVEHARTHLADVAATLAQHGTRSRGSRRKRGVG